MPSPDTDHGTASVWAAGRCWQLLRHSLHCCCSDLTTPWALWHQNQTEMLLLTSALQTACGGLQSFSPTSSGLPRLNLSSGDRVPISRTLAFLHGASWNKKRKYLYEKKTKNTSEGLQEEAGWRPAEEPMARKLSEEAHHLLYFTPWALRQVWTPSPNGFFNPITPRDSYQDTKKFPDKATYALQQERWDPRARSSLITGFWAGMSSF